ncbi:hypothetical protein [Azohydromonas australica]|uniref:hypothetical protein n=1 Tax=Azohydromonas australica TaxID=364039 RepID=UPI001EE3FB20|nr:hypothetical protein [Azohydromonas australica]
MSVPPLQGAAAELQRHLADLNGHTAAHVRPYGKHLLIRMHGDNTVETVARLTEAAPQVHGGASQSRRLLGAIVGSSSRYEVNCRNRYHPACATPETFA